MAPDAPPQGPVDTAGFITCRPSHPGQKHVMHGQAHSPEILSTPTFSWESPP